MKQRNRLGFLLIVFCTLPLLATSYSYAAGEPATTNSQRTEMRGSVELGGKPVAGATVALWATSGAEAPRKLVTANSGADGAFLFWEWTAPADAVLYVVAHDEAKQLAMLSVLGTNPPQTVVVNEMTTVASAFTSARFINGESISGNPLGLRIAAGNSPNLVDPVTGKWGKVLLDPLNSTQTTTLTKLNTLGSLITAFGTVADDAWKANFFKAATPIGGATPKNTLEAMAGHDTTGHPEGTKPGDVIHVFESGGIQINTDVQIDPAGNVWSANNWNNVEAEIADNPPRATSTWGGGHGVTVIYGVAAPVKTPLVGPVQRP